MHCDSPGDSYADCRDLSLRFVDTPHTAAPGDPLCGDPEVLAAPDSSFFQLAYEGYDIERLRQLDYRVHHELARAMPRNATASVDVDHPAAVDRAVLRLRPAPCCEDVGVLQEQDSRAACSRGHGGMDVTLPLPGDLVVDRFAIKPRAIHGKCHGSTVREDGCVTAVVFIHGVGGPTSGWDLPLREHAEMRDPAVAASLTTHTIEFVDLIARQGPIRRVPAAQRPVPVVTHNTPQIRVSYLRRQQRLRSVTWRSRHTVMVPRIKWPYLLPGEALVRLPMWDMRQAGHYRHHAGLRAEVLDRIATELAGFGEDVVLMAHSLGSVVALDALHLRDIRLKMLITLGSPLGIRHFWGKQWESAESFPYERVGSWLNVVNVRDPVPWTRGVNKRFPQAVDAYIDVGSRVSGAGSYHDPSNYASSGPVISALIDLARSEMTDVPVDSGHARVRV